MKLPRSRRKARKAYDEQMARWEAAMERWERSLPPMTIKFDRKLSEEDVERIKERFLSYYQKLGGRPL